MNKLINTLHSGSSLCFHFLVSSFFINLSIKLREKKEEDQVLRKLREEIDSFFSVKSTKRTLTNKQKLLIKLFKKGEEEEDQLVLLTNRCKQNTKIHQMIQGKTKKKQEENYPCGKLATSLEANSLRSSSSSHK